MADSKAYLSFVLLFAFLLSSHVLTRELPEDTPSLVSTKAKAEREKVEIYCIYTKSPVLTDTLSFVPTKAKEEGEEGEIYCIITKSPGGTRAEVDENIPTADSKPKDIQWPLGHWFPLRQDKTRKDHYTDSIGYHNSIGLQSTFSPHNELASKETRNQEDGTVMRDRKVIRPSETDDWKSFHAFSSKSSRMTDADKTGYNGASNVEGEVGEETVN